MIFIREETMPDTQNKEKKDQVTKPAPKQAPAAASETTDIVKTRRTLGLVEILMIMLLAGVVFIFIFGMQQMKREREQELAMQAKFEQVLPTFAQVAQAAKGYKNADEFGAWPIDIAEIADPAQINTPEFKFSWLDSGVVELKTTKEFGKEGIRVSYDVANDSYSIDDPDPSTKPVIKESWVGQ